MVSSTGQSTTFICGNPKQYLANIYAFSSSNAIVSECMDSILFFVCAEIKQIHVLFLP